MSENATTPPSSPRPPSSPLTPGTGISRGSTCVGGNEIGVQELEATTVATEKEVIEGVSPTTRSQNVQSDAFDPESQQQIPRRGTITDSLKRAGTSFSRAGTSLSSRIPVHWRPNYLNDGRKSQRIDDHPMGYPRLGSYMNSDENFLLCRRYSLLHTRVMLYRQAELAQLERELFESDQEDEKDEEKALRDVNFLDEGEVGKSRMKLMKQIEEKLKDYGMSDVISLSSWLESCLWQIGWSI